MLGSLFKVLVVTLIVLAITTGLGLVIMAGVAGTHDVKNIPIPKESSLLAISQMWDYADAYRRPMEYNSYRDIHQVIQNVSTKGEGEIHRTDREVVFAGKLPGIDYQVAYLLDRDTYPPAVEMVTVYRIKDRTGRYLWKLYKPVHRCLAPFLLDRLGSRAPS
ncbi:MAG TPA: hypothetical protein VFH88_14115 [Candidatus Krumholzibacteria bacterium]|nr:hypothetical protein [Candidatus Krumholzibacteria bacterium]